MAPLAQMSNSDYETLDSFIKTVTRRLSEGKTSSIDASEDIMHALTAWDRGVPQEFVPWMTLRMKDWEEDDAFEA